MKNPKCRMKEILLPHPKKGAGGISRECRMENQNQSEMKKHFILMKTAEWTEVASDIHKNIYKITSSILFLIFEI
ncbi:MAG: hypothetical protein NT007_17870 [Candidatus Kapabacteria bacterium]|nr:hypothetical protein [Candidatus Kapabacteria bacterium]